MAPIDDDGPDEAQPLRAPGNVMVLEPDDEDRVPTEDEVKEYAEYLGLDWETEAQLRWIAEEGVIAPVPHPWKACTENGDDVFYFNFQTGESIWDHPCDEQYRNMVEDCRRDPNAHKPSSKSGGQTGGKPANKEEMHSIREQSSPSPNRQPDAAQDQSFSAASVRSSEKGDQDHDKSSIIEESMSMSPQGASNSGKVLADHKESPGNINTSTSKADVNQSPAAMVTSFAASADESFSAASLSSPQGKSAASFTSPTAEGKKLNMSASLEEESSMLSPPLPSIENSPVGKPINKDLQVSATPEKGLAGVGLAGALGLSAPPSIAVTAKAGGSGSGGGNKSSSGTGGKSSGEKQGRSVEADEIEEDLDESVSGSASQSGAPSFSGPGGGLPRPTPGAFYAPPQLDHSGPFGGSGGRGCSSASELSDDFVSEPTSPALSQHGFKGRSNSIGGDTLELSLSVSAADNEDTGSSAVMKPTGKATPEQLELQISSLARSLSMLKDIRMKQQQYLQLLLTGAPISAT